jgi:hypothetical protein
VELFHLAAILLAVVAGGMAIAKDRPHGWIGCAAIALALYSFVFYNP